MNSGRRMVWFIEKLLNASFLNCEGYQYRHTYLYSACGFWSWCTRWAHALASAIENETLRPGGISRPPAQLARVGQSGDGPSALALRFITNTESILILFFYAIRPVCPAWTKCDCCNLASFAPGLIVVFHFHHQSTNYQK